MNDQSKESDKVQKPSAEPVPTTAPKEEKPDPNVKPPAYQYLTEGYDPDRAKRPKV